jgi:outer membrane protein TolC
MRAFTHLFSVLLLFFVQLIFAQNHLTLEDYRSLAKNNSPLLNDFNNQRFSLKLDSLKLRADYGVKVNGLGDASYSPLFGSWGYNGSVAAGQNLAALVRVSKELLGKKNKETRFSNYSLSMQQMLNQSAITELQLNRLVTEQYINTYAAQQKYKVNQEIVKVLQQEDLILKKLTQNVVFKQTDYLSFKVTLQQNILAMEQQKADWLNNFATLNYIAGNLNSDFSSLEKPNIQSGLPKAFDESIYKESYKTDSLKLANDAKIINLDYQPKISVYADGGYSSALLNTPYKNFGTSVGLSLNIPIYDGHKRKISLEQNKLSQHSLEKYNQSRKTQYQIQIHQLEEQIRQNQMMLKTANEQLVYAKTLIEANLKQLPTGDVRVADFILSINNYINLKLGLVTYETTIENLKNHLQNLILP